MPTVDQWIEALFQNRDITVVSSPEMIQRVERKQQVRDALLASRSKPIPSRKPLAVVSEFAPTRTVTVRPLVLLHRLGVVTTPPIPNLADLSSSWAYFRYVWAFEPSGTLLRLSEPAKQIDFHQKGLLSDQIGIGIAATLMEASFAAPLALDVSVALDDPGWPIELDETTSPDYLFFDSTQARLYVVECKGSQGSADTVFNQLRRGVEQVPSLVFQDGRQPPAYVIGTHLTTEFTHVYFLDPPSDEDEPRLPRNAKRAAKTVWKVENTDVFTRRNGLVAEAKLLAYAGNTPAARAKVHDAGLLGDWPEGDSISEPLIVENQLGVFSGVERIIDVSDGVEVRAFQGIDRRTLAKLTSGETDNATKLEDAKSAESRVVTEEIPSGISVASVSSDGSVLQVRVQSK